MRVLGTANQIETRQREREAGRAGLLFREMINDWHYMLVIVFGFVFSFFFVVVLLPSTLSFFCEELIVRSVRKKSN